MQKFLAIILLCVVTLSSAQAKGKKMKKKQRKSAKHACVVKVRMLYSGSSPEEKSYVYPAKSKKECQNYSNQHQKSSSQVVARSSSVEWEWK